jgi:hypothetical protein
MQSQYDALPWKLKEISQYFCYLSEQYGVEPVVTRVNDPIAGESGVHRDNRAIDFRCQYQGDDGGHFLYSEEQISDIVQSINSKYPRPDEYFTCKYHSFQEGPYHFHLQVSYSDTILPDPNSATV